MSAGGDRFVLVAHPDNKRWQDALGRMVERIDNHELARLPLPQPQMLDIRGTALPWCLLMKTVAMRGVVWVLLKAMLEFDRHHPIQGNIQDDVVKAVAMPSLMAVVRYYFNREEAEIVEMAKTLRSKVHP